jgi:hypothetical protein
MAPGTCPVLVEHGQGRGDRKTLLSHFIENALLRNSENGKWFDGQHLIRQLSLMHAQQREPLVLERIRGALARSKCAVGAL